MSHRLPRPHRARESSLSVLCEYMESMSHADLKFRRISKYPNKVIPPSTSKVFPEFNQNNLIGLYEGVFGPHGLEVCGEATTLG